MTLGIAVIGCGMMGGLHGQTWAARDDARVVAVSDPIEDRAHALAEATGAIVASSNTGAIGRDEVDAVSICTPVCFHSEIACLAAEHGKHVLTEKPMALTLPQADAMIAAARDNGVLLGVSLQYRAIPKYRRYHDLILEGAFGGPVFARFEDVREVRPKLAMHRRSMNGGPVIDMAGHYFDLMRFCTGDEPASVFARGHVFGEGKARLAGIDDLAVDAAEITVTMQSGHVLSVFVNWGMPEEFPNLGREQLIGPEVAVWPEEGVVVAQYRDRQVRYRLPSHPFGPAARIDDLARAIKGEEPLEVTGEEGRIALQVSLAALTSIETGDVVTL